MRTHKLLKVLACAFVVSFMTVSKEARSEDVTIEGQHGVLGVFDSAALSSNNISPHSERERILKYSPIIIPDGDRKGKSISFRIDEDCTIISAAISLDISHGFVSDLIVRFIHPDGTNTVLRGRSDEFASDDGLQVKYGGIGGVPSQVLNILPGKSTQGVWTVNISDVSDGSTGTLNRLVLDFRTFKSN